jgi:signal transduction histidine kinase
MSCSIIFYKNGIPVAITIKKHENSLIFKINENQFSIPIENIERVLGFFK